MAPKNDGKPENKAQRNARHDREDQAAVQGMTIQDRTKGVETVTKLRELNEQDRPKGPRG